MRLAASLEDTSLRRGIHINGKRFSVLFWNRRFEIRRYNRVEAEPLDEARLCLFIPYMTGYMRDFIYAGF